MPNNIFDTLQHVTHRKLANLREKRDRLTRLRNEAARRQDVTPSNTLEALLAIFDKLGEAETRLESPVHVNLTPKLLAELNQQAVYDRTITSSMLMGWCSLLNRILDQRMRQISHAMLYGHLVIEWVQDHKKKQEDAEKSATTSREALHQQRQEWEALAFRQDPVQEEKLVAFLVETFAAAMEPLKKASSSALDQLRDKIEYHSQNFARFDEDAVRQAIDEVLSNDLYAGEKRANLRDLRVHKSVLREIADVLNQDLENLESWQWADGGVQLSMRRHINGKYRVYMDEQVYQAIFLAHIGSAWSDSFHSAFGQFFDETWKHGAGRKPTKEQQRFRSKRFHQVNESIEAERTASLSHLRRRQYKDKFWLSAISPIARRSLARDYEGDGDDSYPPTFSDIKQQLLRMITAEQLIQCDLYGQFTVLQSDFRWFGPSLSHTTILTVLKFFGLPKKWLDFFAKFLSPYISFASDGAQAQRCKRTCGTPIAHQLSSLFGEIVMVALDFAVNEATDGGYLYRIHDDLWFWGQQDQCAMAWETLQKFSAATGLELNMDKTAACTLQGLQAPLLKDEDAQEKPKLGKADPILPWRPVRWGFLVLSEDKGYWDIDQKQLEEHIDEMRVQLDATGSVMSWVRVWNSYMSNFFVNNFGKPAQCLGQEHIRICMRAFETVQQRLLQADGRQHANLTDTVAAMIQERSGEEKQTVQASMIYFPAELGGLAVQNPLIELNAKLLAEKQDNQQEIVQKAWRGAHERFDRLIERWDNAIFRRKPRGDEFSADNDEEAFMTFQDFMANAEETEPELSKAYTTLLKDLGGNEEGIKPHSIFDENKVDGAQAYQQAASKSGTSFYWKRIVQLYGDKAIEYYGSLAMSQASALPMGVINYLSSEKLRWQN
ncbi:uncharacterized protein UTRI_10317 [Ustilago trichophora]|uniref:Uncharacterized protein n=1 Tax=Ustilago trichophora TaxID=86804 RepID=A0A5C3EP94_9BASI|nr:uncharacterized protein UTRI_10317 [Ustilago trichophora]